MTTDGLLDLLEEIEGLADDANTAIQTDSYALEQIVHPDIWARIQQTINSIERIEDLTRKALKDRTQKARVRDLIKRLELFEDLPVMLPLVREHLDVGCVEFCQLLEVSPEPFELWVRWLEPVPAHLRDKMVTLLRESEARVTDQQDEKKEPELERDSDGMTKWFAYRHLPEKLQVVSRQFGELADFICATIEPGPERTAALRKLLESKDAAVRASVHPGG